MPQPASSCLPRRLRLLGSCFRRFKARRRRVARFCAAWPLRARSGRFTGPVSQLLRVRLQMSLAILLDQANRFSNHADMSQPLLRELFGPSREELWRQLASELNANYVDGDFWERGKIQASHAGWLITLEERSEEHTSELQSLRHLVCRLLLE